MYDYVLFVKCVAIFIIFYSMIYCYILFEFKVNAVFDGH
jgi:hypothetical protein